MLGQATVIMPCSPHLHFHFRIQPPVFFDVLQQVQRRRLVRAYNQPARRIIPQFGKRSVQFTLQILETPRDVHDDLAGHRREKGLDRGRAVQRVHAGQLQLAVICIERGDVVGCHLGLPRPANRFFEPARTAAE